MAGVEPPEHIPDSEVQHYRRDDKPVPLHDATGPKTDEDWLRVTREFAEASVKEIKERLFPYHGLSADAP